MCHRWSPPKGGSGANPRPWHRGGIGPPPPVRLPTPRPEEERPLSLWPQPLQLPPAACYTAGMAQRPQISNPLNPASRGSLTAEPNGATRRGGEDCEAGRERWNCGGGLAPPSNHRPGALRVDTWCSTSHPVCVCPCATETPPPVHSMSQEAPLSAPFLLLGHPRHKRAPGWLILHGRSPIPRATV